MGKEKVDHFWPVPGVATFGGRPERWDCWGWDDSDEGKDGDNSDEGKDGDGEGANPENRDKENEA